MELRQLGKDGPEVSVVGLGAFPPGGAMGGVDEEVAIGTVRAAEGPGLGVALDDDRMKALTAASA